MHKNFVCFIRVHIQNIVRLHFLCFTYSLWTGCYCLHFLIFYIFYYSLCNYLTVGLQKGKREAFWRYWRRNENAIWTLWDKADNQVMWFWSRCLSGRGRRNIYRVILRLSIVVFSCLLLFAIFNYRSRCRYEMPTVFGDPVFLHADASRCRIDLDSLGQRLVCPLKSVNFVLSFLQLVLYTVSCKMHVLW